MIHRTLFFAAASSILLPFFVNGQECFSDWTLLAERVAAASQTIYILCPDTVLQVPGNSGEGMHTIRVKFNSTFQCGVDGAEAGCVIQPLNTGTVRSYFFNVQNNVTAASYALFKGLTMRQAPNFGASGAVNAEGADVDPSFFEEDWRGGATFEDCIFEDNFGSGITVGCSAAIIVKNSVFRRNQYISIYNRQSSDTVCLATDLVVDSSVFEDNFGGIYNKVGKLSIYNSCFIGHPCGFGAVTTDYTTNIILNENNFGQDNTECSTEVFEFDADSCSVDYFTTSPTPGPSSIPTMSPTLKPSVSPSGEPSATPTVQPTRIPSTVPTGYPTTKDPSGSPTGLPTSRPTTVPSSTPSATPTPVPSSTPSEMPSAYPVSAPSTFPTLAPSQVPSVDPTVVPSEDPSSSPSKVPSGDPTFASSEEPTSIPSSAGKISLVMSFVLSMTGAAMWIT
jgi:hypothetical protein